VEQRAVVLSETERRSDWEARLSAHLADAQAQAASGDLTLCGLLAAGAVEAVTGTNPVAPLNGKYARAAARLEAFLDERFHERPAALARRGDLAWHDGSVGVVIGTEALFVGEGELVRVPRRDWAKAWSVGNG